MKEWVCKPVNQHRPRIDVKIFIEGYRPTKDIWEHETYDFLTLNEAFDFYEKVMSATTDEREKLLDFEYRYRDTGWYGFSLEYMEVYEYSTTGNVFKWEYKTIEYYPSQWP